MTNCKYNPDPSGFYETPPVAPPIASGTGLGGGAIRPELSQHVTHATTSPPFGARDTFTYKRNSFGYRLAAR